MSLAAVCGWTCLRSLLLAVLAMPVMFLMCGVLKSSRGVVRKLLWVGLLAPFFTPELMVGYAYSAFALSLIHHPVWNELLYAVLIGSKFIPVGTLVMYFAPPPPLSAEARFCRQLAIAGTNGIGRQVRAEIESILYGPARAAFAAGALVFLLSFQEFEIASLMGTTTWTKWLFNVQAGGLLLSQSWRYATIPLTWETLILLPALLVILMSRYLPSTPELASSSLSGRARWLAGCYLAASVAAVCVVPAFLVIRGVAGGFGLLWRDQHLRLEILKEILRSGTMAVVAAAIAFGVTAWVLSVRGRRMSPRVQIVAAVLLSLPGLAGPLILGLSVLHFFQHSMFQKLYDTPLALLVAQVLFLVPRAFLLQLFLRALQPAEALHLAGLLHHSPFEGQQRAARELNWNLKLRGCFWGIVLLCNWAYLDLTISSLLAPTGMVAAPVRLYNLMHYGQSSLLSAMLVTTIAVPVLFVLILMAARRPLGRWLYR